MRGWLGGLVIGLIVGAGAMYLVLHVSGGSGATTTLDAGVVAQAPADAGTKKPTKRPGGKRVPRPGAGRQTAGPDFDPDSGDDSAERPPPLISVSAADRALEWRGDQTSISRKIDMNAPGDARPMEPNEYGPVISDQTGPVRACVTSSAANTDLRGTIDVKIVVEGNGKVTRSQLHAPRYMFEKGLLGCAQRALSGLKFPATGAPTLVSFPINFT